MTTAGDTMAHGVALRLRALAATRWIDCSDEATRAALLAGADEVERLTRELERLQGARASATPPLPGDLAALARREAGSAHQWRQCRRCGRCFWLTPDESVPEHQAQVLGVERACGWTVTAKESE
jgi:hypothetical protein